MDDGYCFWCEVIAKARADERWSWTISRAAEASILDELRARVEALPTEYDSAVEDYVSRADVLALLDGGSDG
jgi:hypothetical protein